MDRTMHYAVLTVILVYLLQALLNPDVTAPLPGTPQGEHADWHAIVRRVTPAIQYSVAAGIGVYLFLGRSK